MLEAVADQCETSRVSGIACAVSETASATTADSNPKRIATTVKRATIASSKANSSQNEGATRR